MQSFNFSLFEYEVRYFVELFDVHTPNDGASAAAHLRPALILAENTKLHF